MTKLPIISSRQLIRAFRAAGFEYAPKRGKRSHIAMVKKDNEKTRLVIVPESRTCHGALCMQSSIKLDLVRPNF